ncbi:transmembrane protein 72 isoform X4 [Crotalus tigris]|uniref:transmembrane protein 72 isoform X4 n=1 Tax=Crotalus tigris TaxID=88082 RepID=UPI00192F2323|nr:transmembrane protein 72 isoform X4 [Crotalus tigris]
MKQTVIWSVLEYVCRLLGVSTGAVLLGVGIDTLLHGQSKSLALYLLISGMAVSLWEVAYFASLLLISCFVPWRGSAMHTCWLRAKRRGAFQKFLAYALLSIACFLSPVHVWQVMLPGTQLILTSLAYFLLSKQQKEDTGNGPPEQSSDPHDEAVDEMAEDRSRETSSFHRKFGSLAGRLRSFFQACQRPKAFMASSCLVSRKKPVGLEEQVEEMVLPLGEEPEGLAKESTSETAFILSPQM